MTSTHDKNRHLLPSEGDQVYVGRVVGVSPPEQSPAESANEHSAEHSANDEPLGRLGRSKLAILVTVFVAAGIIGLPLILMSPAFSKAEKIFWTAVVLCYTVLVFYILWLLVSYTARLIYG
jgi:hypothetical protein